MTLTVWLLVNAVLNFTMFGVWNRNSTINFLIKTLFLLFGVANLAVALKS